MRQRVVAALHAHGWLTTRQLQRQLGPHSTGSCHIWILDYFRRIGGLSPTLRAALSAALWNGEIEIVPIRRSLWLRATGIGVTGNCVASDKQPLVH
jgi:hypothetical protein